MLNRPMMTHHLADYASYLGGFSASISTLLGSLSTAEGAGGWLQIVVQAGMAGIVVLIVMKHIPRLITSQEETNKLFLGAIEKEREANRESTAKDREMYEKTIDRIIQSQEIKDAAWQQIVMNRGICPINQEDRNKQEIGS